MLFSDRKIAELKSREALRDSTSPKTCSSCHGLIKARASLLNIMTTLRLLSFRPRGLNYHRRYVLLFYELIEGGYIGAHDTSQALELSIYLAH